MPISWAELLGSHRPVPDAPVVGAVPPGEAITVSIYLKDEGGDPLLEKPPQQARAVPAAVTRSALAKSRVQTCQGDLGRIAAFAREQGLTVGDVDAARRRLTVSGPADRIEAAFQTKLKRYDDGSGPFRARSGILKLPADIVDSVGGVFGLDTRPIATPKLQVIPRAAASASFLPSAVGQIYGFPAGPAVGKGQCIAIIELGGGYLDSDTKTAFATMHLPPPKVTAVPVDGGSNTPDGGGADGEVALDIQVAGAVAPAATIAVYFAPNTVQGFVDAISQAVHDKVNKPMVISISWGAPESGWTQQGLDAMNAAMKDAATLGITVCAASGDGLATDGVGNGKAHVDFPASSPYALGCGGTVLRATAGKRVSESVWNAGDGGTGGGVSTKFAKPAYQAKAKVPKGGGKTGGRGVPDVAADADPNSGYLIVVGGKVQQIGGTSAVAPLYAGLFAAINAATGKPAGFVHPVLYGNPAAFNDILTGNNKAGAIGYAAGPGWDACTGLGTPVGSSILQLFGKPPKPAAP